MISSIIFFQKDLKDTFLIKEISIRTLRPSPGMYNQQIGQDSSTVAVPLLALKEVGQFLRQLFSGQVRMLLAWAN